MANQRHAGDRRTIASHSSVSFISSLPATTPDVSVFRALDIFASRNTYVLATAFLLAEKTAVSKIARRFQSP
jgi:hypothetical protein